MKALVATDLITYRTPYHERPSLVYRYYSRIDTIHGIITTIQGVGNILKRVFTCYAHFSIL